MNQTYTSDVGRLLHNAHFMMSCADSKSYPADEGQEVAFVGRSNAGKSSAINIITQKKKLAFSSKTPGRTQLINFFELDSSRRLVDLPGYGFANAPIATQRAWGENLEDYFSLRKSLVGLVWLMDIRHPFQKYDRVMLDWLADKKVPVQLLLSKADKLTRNRANQAVFSIRQHLREVDHLDIQAQSFSSFDRQGLPTLFSKLAFWFGLANSAEK